MVSKSTFFKIGSLLSPEPHKKIHQGTMYSCSRIEPAVADGSSLDVIMSNPSGVYPHLVFSIGTFGNAKFQLYEGPTFDADGTSLTIFNHKRYSANTFTGTVTYGNTVSNVGTLIQDAILPGGEKAHAIGTSDSFQDEWCLKNNEDYLLRLTNLSGAASDLHMALMFYTSYNIPD